MWLTTLYQWPPQLHKFKLGIVTGVLAVTWALSGAAVGKLSDKLGVRKPILLGAVLGVLGVLGCGCPKLGAGLT